MSKATELAPNFAVACATKWYVQYRILSNSGDSTGAQECIQQFQEMTKKFETCPDVFSLYGQVLTFFAQYLHTLKTQNKKILKTQKNRSSWKRGASPKPKKCLSA
jgi:hypothetical protein